MTREEFDALPVALQIRFILEAFPSVEDRVLEIEAPPRPARPKYDVRIGRSRSYQWASETELSDLRFFHQRARSNTAAEFAERNLREAGDLMRWIRWREYYPTAVWDGERFRRKCTAEPPSATPKLHPWEVRNATSAPPADARPLTNINFRALDGDDSDQFEEEEQVANGF